MERTLERERVGMMLGLVQKAKKHGEREYKAQFSSQGKGKDDDFYRLSSLSIVVDNNR